MRTDGPIDLIEVFNRLSHTQDRHRKHYSLQVSH